MMQTILHLNPIMSNEYVILGSLIYSLKNYIVEFIERSISHIAFMTYM